MSPSNTARDNKALDTTVIIIGAGIGGLLTGIALKRQWGFEDFLIYEKGSDIGGTWRDNVYPGCSSDVMIHWYSLSTDLNPNWNSYFGTRGEIQNYLLDVTAKYSLRSHCVFDTAVLSAEWDSKSKMYHITTENVKTGERKETRAKIVMSAPGSLCEPNMPRIPGIDSFKGPLFHSARWRHDVSLKGQRVAVIGNGCSGAQLIPMITEDPSVDVVNFCRQPMWFKPRLQVPYTNFQKWVFANVPFAMRGYRWLVAFSYDINFIGFRGHHSWLSKRITKEMTAYIKQTAPPQYHSKLVPDYTPGCKRIVYDTGYLKALYRPNLDLRWDEIDHIVEDGIVMKSGDTIPVDVIVCATGFVTDKYPIHIRGRTGETLDEYYASKGGPTAYLGTTAPGFPNFCMLFGPSTATGHASVIFSEEVQVNYSLQLMKPIIFDGVASFEPTSSATDAYNDYIQSRISNSVWTQCTSWYRSGAEGKIYSTFPGPLAEFWLWCRTPRWGDYLFEGEGIKWWERRRKMRTVARTLGQLMTIVGVAWVLKDLMRNDGEIKSLWFRFMMLHLDV